MIVTEDVLPSIGKADDANYLSDRVRYFYNIQSLPTFLDSLLSYPESALDTFYRLIYLGIGYVREYSGVSHLASLLPKVGPDSASLYDKGFLDNHGYLALKAETDASFEVRRRSFVEDEQWIVRDRQERDLKERILPTRGLRSAGRIWPSAWRTSPKVASDQQSLCCRRSGPRRRCKPSTPLSRSRSIQHWSSITTRSINTQNFLIETYGLMPIISPLSAHGWQVR